ncbi:Tetraspanin-9 [Bienertia sinuspersici]
MDKSAFYFFLLDMATTWITIGAGVYLLSHISTSCSVPSVVAAAAFLIFTLVVSKKGVGNSIPGRSYKEYHVESYSKWMQNKVNNPHNWENYYKKAVIKGKPPEDCKFHYKSSTVWIKPKDANYSKIDDCEEWNNEPNILCFDCDHGRLLFFDENSSYALELH